MKDGLVSPLGFCQNKGLRSKHKVIVAVGKIILVLNVDWAAVRCQVGRSGIGDLDGGDGAEPCAALTANEARAQDYLFVGTHGGYYRVAEGIGSLEQIEQTKVICRDSLGAEKISLLAARLCPNVHSRVSDAPVHIFFAMDISLPLMCRRA